MTRPTHYQEATARAQERKAVLLSSLSEAKTRLAPGRLLDDVRGRMIGSITAIPSQAVEKARQRPIAVGAAAGALLIYLLRRPLWTLFGRLYVRVRNRNRETDNG